MAFVVVLDASVIIAFFDPADAHPAAELRSQHTSLCLPDALVLATADELNASAVLTADVAWTKISPRVQVI